MSTNGTTPTMEQLTEYAYQQADTIDLLTERLADLELALDSEGWQRLTGESEREFSRQALQTIIHRSRMAYLANPLVRHGVDVRSHYVFGQPISWEAADAKVQEVALAFWDDPDNQTELTSHQAMIDKERQLQTDGNLFIAHFVNMATGQIRLRSILVDEIQQIITNPDDDKEPWYYKRVYSRRVLNVATGAEEFQQTTEYYPDWRYEPTGHRPLTINGKAVRWNVPVRHIKTGGFNYQRFGIPEAYPALDWAKAVRNDLEDYATVKRALARFSWDLTVKGGSKAVSAARTKLNSTLGNSPRAAETNPPPNVGSTFIGSDMASLTPIKTAGAQPSPEEGRRLGLMVAAGMGIPETILFGDADVGNLATAKTLDRPTELKMQTQQTMWEAILKDELNYAVDWAVRAPGGALSGTVIRDGHRVIVDMGQVDRHIDIDFPSILERNTKELVDAIVAAANTNSLHPEMVARELMYALGVDDVDEEMKKLEPILKHKVDMILNPPPAPTFGQGDDRPIPPRRSDVDEAMIEAAEQLRDALVRLSEGQAA